MPNVAETLQALQADIDKATNKRPALEVGWLTAATLCMLQQERIIELKATIFMLGGDDDQPIRRVN